MRIEHDDDNGDGDNHRRHGDEPESSPPASMVSTEHSSSSSSSNTEDSTPNKAAAAASSQQRHTTTLPSFRDLVDPSKPWVLVDDGSFGNYFDWVPRQWRVGPWSATAIAYWTALWYVAALAGCYFVATTSKSDDEQLWWSLSALEQQQQQQQQLDVSYSYLHYFDASTTSSSRQRAVLLRLVYNTVAFLWMMYVMYLIQQGPMGWKAWSTYTVQSWTLLTLRHGLVAAIIVTTTTTTSDNDSDRYRHFLVLAAELIRFPVACSATITFGVWNFCLAPFIYIVALKTAEQRQRFLQFITSFRLTQVHVFNIVLTYFNVKWSSPLRKLHAIDLYVAVVSVLLYMAFYLCVLDRLGIHFYPIFSPRLPSRLVAVAWTVLLSAYIATFVLWRHILWPTTQQQQQDV